jgi:hypothetical protein
MKENCNDEKMKQGVTPHGASPQRTTAHRYQYFPRPHWSITCVMSGRNSGG